MPMREWNGDVEYEQSHRCAPGRLAAAAQRRAAQLCREPRLGGALGPAAAHQAEPYRADVLPAPAAWAGGAAGRAAAQLDGDAAAGAVAGAGCARARGAND